MKGVSFSFSVVTPTRKLGRIRVLLSGVEPTTFRLLVRMLYLGAIGDSPVLTRGYSEEFECSFSGVEPTTFRLLVRMLYLGAIGDSPVVTRGYSEEFECSFSEVEPTTFRLLVRMHYLGGIGDSPVVTRGYSEESECSFSGVHTYIHNLYFDTIRIKAKSLWGRVLHVNT